MADLRRKQPPTEQIAPRNVDTPGLKGQIPFSPGRIILTDAEKQFLKTNFGWKDGDPIPDLTKVVEASVGKKLPPGEIKKRAQELAGVQRELRETGPAQYPDTAKDFMPPETIAIEGLPEEKRLEIVEALKRAKQQADSLANNKGQEQPFIPRDPSIGKAHAFAEAQAAAQRRRVAEAEARVPKVALEDDRSEAARTRPAVTRPEEPESSPAPDTVKSQSDAGAEAQRTHCQHCGWDLSRADDAEMTDEDKRVYTAALLGPNRFVKTYHVMDGALHITFRALTTKEADLILRQLYLDGRNGDVSSPPEVFRRAQEYQLAVCLQSMHSDGNAINLPPVDQHELDADANTTGLPAVLDYVYTEAVPQETLRRILLNLYAQFDGTLSKLEAWSTQKGFSKAIG